MDFKDYFSLKIISSVIEAVASFVTMAFGIYGATNDTKPVNGKLTRKGKIAISGIVVSGLIAVIIKVIAVEDKLADQKKIMQEQDQKIIQQKLEAAKKQHDDSLNNVFQRGVNSGFGKSLGKLETLESKQRSAIDQLNSLSVLQKQNIGKSLELQHPLFPLKLSSTVKVSLDSLDKSQMIIDTLQSYKRYLWTKRNDLHGLPLGVQTIWPENGEKFDVDRFDVNATSGFDARFIAFDKFVRWYVFPKYDIKLYLKDKFLLEIDYHEGVLFEKAFLLSYKVDMIKREVVFEFENTVNTLKGRLPDNRGILSFYSCRDGVFKASVRQNILGNSIKGIELGEITINCGDKFIDSYKFPCQPKYVVKTKYPSLDGKCYFININDVLPKSPTAH
ncbi:hypothetical protein ACFGVR_14100 [Mucilaginibacter sp. AW1-3]